MNRKRLYTIFLIILLLIILFLKCSVVDDKTKLNMSSPAEITEDTGAAQETFEELVTKKYLDGARDKKRNKLLMIRDEGISKRVNKSTTDQEAIYKLLDYFNNLNLTVGTSSSSYSFQDNELNYIIWFENTTEFESIQIETNSDNELFTYIIFHLISEDKEKKIITHERDYVIERYTLVNGSIDYDFLEEIFDSMEENH